MRFSFKIIVIIIVMAMNNIAYGKNNNKINITTSIIPIQSLTAMVIDGTQNSLNVVLDNSNTSPHESVINYAEIKIIKNSSILFVISRNLETEILKNIDAKTKVIYLDEMLEDKLDDFNELSYKNVSTPKQTNDHHHNHEIKDYHIWLDTNKSQQILYIIANELSKLDPINKEKYHENAKKYSLKIQELQKEMQQNLSLISGNFMVYHNAWGYFLKENNLEKNFKGSIIANEADHSHVDTNLSAKNVIEITKYLAKEKITCILLEPQFEDKTIKTIIEKNNIKTATLDPIGKKTENLKNNYFEMMKKNTQQLKSCV